MNTNLLSSNKIDLVVILNNLKSKNNVTIEYDCQQIILFLNQNREHTDDIISQIAEFFDKNIDSIPDNIFIKVLNLVLVNIIENNYSISNFMNKFFPILIYIVYHCNRTISQFDSIIETIGILIKKCGFNSSQIIELQINSIFTKFSKDENFKFDFSKYALINSLTAFIKNAPVISYNKIFKSFEIFSMIILNYKDHFEYIRLSIQKLVQEFLKLLNNREKEVKENYVQNLYNLCIDKNLNNKNIDSDTLHGVILISQALTIRKEFFSSKFDTIMDFLYSHKNHKMPNIKKIIIKVLPDFCSYLPENFEKKYFDKFLNFYMDEIFIKKPPEDIKSELLLLFGRMSKVASIKIYGKISQKLIGLVRNDLERSKIFNINMLNFFTDILENYPEELFAILPFKVYCDKIFNCGFYENHIGFLKILIDKHEYGSRELITIILVILNVISIIICGKNFELKDSINKIKLFYKYKEIDKDDYGEIALSYKKSYDITHEKEEIIDNNNINNINNINTNNINTNTNNINTNNINNNNIINTNANIESVIYNNIDNNIGINIYEDLNTSGRKSVNSDNKNINQPNSDTRRTLPPSKPKSQIPTDNEFTEEDMLNYNKAGDSIRKFIALKSKEMKAGYEEERKKLLKNALTFLKFIDNQVFEKDILKFYEENCIKLMDYTDPELMKIIISLANSPWVPETYIKEEELEKLGKYDFSLKLRKQSTKTFKTNKVATDYEIDYNINLITESLINLLLNETDDTMRILILNTIDDPRYYYYISKKEIFSKLILVLNYDNNTAKEKIVEIIGKVIKYNYDNLAIYKKVIMQIFLILEASNNKLRKEENIVLLSYFVKYTDQYIVDYVDIIFNTLLKILKEETEFKTESNIEQLLQTNDLLIISILSIISELMKSKEEVKKQVDPYEKDILMICINILKGNSSCNKQRTALNTIYSILKNSKKEWKIYSEYLELVSLLIQVLSKSSDKSSRYFSLKIFGLIGTMDPDKLKVLFNLHQIKNNISSSDFIISDELKNFEDNIIILNDNVDTGVNLNKNLYDGLNTNRGLKGILCKNTFKFDFEKAINEDGLDGESYLAMKCLMKVMENNSNSQEVTYRIINILTKTFETLNEKDYPLIYIIFPTLLNLLDTLEGAILTKILEKIYFIIKKYKSFCTPYIEEITNICMKNLTDKDKNTQKISVDVIVKLCEMYTKEMEKYLHKLIPIFLELLEDKDNTCLNIKRKIMTCFFHLTPKLGNYLSLILPEIFSLLTSSMNKSKLISSVALDSKINNINLGQSIMGLNNLSTFSIQNERLKASDFSLNSNNKQNNIDNKVIKVDDLLDKNNSKQSDNKEKAGIGNSKRKNSIFSDAELDNDMLIIIDRFISLPNFVHYIPKVVKILLRLLEEKPEYKMKILNIFLKLLNKNKIIFLPFYPTIIHNMKKNGVSSSEFFFKFRKGLIYDKIVNAISEFNKKNKGFRLNGVNELNIEDDKEDSQRESKASNSGKTIYNRINVINKENCLNEFNPENCSIEDDWYEWFKTSCKSLFLQSPSYILFYCQLISEYEPRILSELYNAAFFSLWCCLSNEQKSELIKFLNQVLDGTNTPNDVSLTILNLSEYICRKEKNRTEFLEFEKLGKVATDCQAYAKALYYAENDYINNGDFSALEHLITLYYELSLPESAIGILKLAKSNSKSSDQKINEDDWYLRLHQWKKALTKLKKKIRRVNGKPDFDLNNEKDLKLLTTNIACLDGLGDWESLLSLCEDIENKNSDKEKQPMAQYAINIAKAAFNLGDWDTLSKYAKFIDPKEDEEKYEYNFFNAIISITESDYGKAQRFIDLAREILDDKIKTLLGESYGRAYEMLLENQNLCELEEIIELNLEGENYDKFKENNNKLYENLNISKAYKSGAMLTPKKTHLPSISNSESKPLKHNKSISNACIFSNIDQNLRLSLKEKWDKRLDIIDENIRTYEKIIGIRNLVFPLEEDYSTSLKLSKICMKKDKFTKCMLVLNRLRKNLEHCGPNINVNITLSISKCIHDNDENENNLDEAINSLKKILDSDLSNIDNKLKSKIYCYYAMWNIQKLEKTDNRFKENDVKNILKDLKNSFTLNEKNYKAWHYYGLLNYKFFEFENTKIEYASNAIKGFIQSVCVGGKNLSKTLQDLLRLIDIWFQVGKNESINELVNNDFNKINIDCWLLVIPQLLSRTGVSNPLIRNSLVNLLKKIGTKHPRSLNYPLIVMLKTKSQSRKEVITMILEEMRRNHGKLIEECEIIINELNRCALLLHELWSEAVEENVKLFKNNEYDNFVKNILEIHEKTNKKPSTLNEIHFHHLFQAELSEAYRLLKTYMETKEITNIKQAWEIYHQMFRNIDINFSNLQYLDLETVSPKLYEFSKSEIEVPGMYRSGFPIIKIQNFGKKLIVLNSKQHPRRIIINGSDGKEYGFLLKGHEDLRQDEKAMQVFGLVNTLLNNDIDTREKNLFIKRFQVIPLSSNVGIIGWVSNCDTIHQLVKEYRTMNKIKLNTEHILMYTYFNKFDSANFMTKLEVFKHALDYTQGVDLQKVLWNKSVNAESWLDRRTNFSRSLAVMSMVGYILGLGDRHPNNLMIDRTTGKIIHIDFGDCFEVAMKREKFPERVPFRLTRMLIKALEIGGIEWTFRLTCENVMRVLRENKDILIAILTDFVHNPLISFKIMIPMIMKQQTRKKLLSETGKNVKSNIPAYILSLKTSEDEVPDVRRVGSAERQLYHEFAEKEDIESDDLNKIAKIVLERIIDKLQGTDFNKNESLDTKKQVEKLILQATSHENLSQSYLGWCPYW